jgi:hypothetical protein
MITSGDGLCVVEIQNMEGDAIATFRLKETSRWLAYLRRFEHFGAAKYLSLLEPTPEGRHYNEFGAGGAAVILGGG